MCKSYVHVLIVLLLRIPFVQTFSPFEIKGGDYMQEIVIYCGTLAYESSCPSSLISARNVFGKTSLAARSEERRLYSQASRWTQIA